MIRPPAHGTAVALATAIFVAGAATAQSSAPAAGGALLARGPLRIVENLGQYPAEVRFAASRGGLDFFFLEDGFVARFTRHVTDPSRSAIERAFSPGIELGDRRVGAAVRFRFEGFAPGTAPRAGSLQRGRTNYLLGNDPAKWRRGARAFDSLVYESTAGGPRLLIRDDGGTLTYDLEIPAGVAESSVRIACEGADSLAVDGDGRLRVRTAAGELIHTAPRSRELVSQGSARPVASRFELVAPGKVGFAAPGRDRARSLVIDPGILYSSFLGGNFSDQAQDVALDPAGSVYVTGFTNSTNFPTTLGAFDTAFNGDVDAFVIKILPDGSDLEYATFLGGEGVDQGIAIAVDAAGIANVAGSTTSYFFPSTLLAFSPVYHGGFKNGDAFVTKLTPDGKDLIASTFLGGVSDETALRIAIDAQQNVVIAGWTRSPDFITAGNAPSAFDNTFNGFTVDLGDAFVAKLDPFLGSMIYATLLGGPEGEAASGLALDSTGRIVVTGLCRSKFPVKAGAFPTYMGNTDGFVAMISPAASGAASLVFSEYLGGTNLDYGYRVAVDATDAILVAGYTTSGDFLKVPGSFDTTYNTFGDVFVLKLNPTGTQLGYSTFLGGAGVDAPSALAVDSTGAAYVAGTTKSANFPVTAGSFDVKANGGMDSFLVKLAPTGAKLLQSSYLGGIFDDAISNMAIAAPDVVWVTGQTYSKNFPIVGPALKSTIFQLDSFVAKIDLSPVPLLCVSDTDPVEVSYDAGSAPDIAATLAISNCGSPESSLAWHVTPLAPAPWLTPSPTTGMLLEGSPAAPCDLAVDPTGLPDGAYPTTLRFENDGDTNNKFDVPVLVTIQQPIVVPVVPGDVLTGAVDFAGEWDSGSFSGVKGMTIKVGFTSGGGDLKPVVSLLDPSDAVVKTFLLPHSEKTLKRTFVLKTDGPHRIVVRGASMTSGLYAVATSQLFPKDAKPFTKKTQPGKLAGAAVEYKVRLACGATLSATVEPLTAVAGPLAFELLDPTQTPIDLSSFTQPFGAGGLQISQVPIPTAGLHLLRITGLANPKEKVSVTVTPSQPQGGATVPLP